MKRLCTLVVLMAVSSSAQAGDSFSFVIGGRRIQIETSGHCRSASCVSSVSIPGIYQMRRGRDRYDDDEREVAAPAKLPLPAPIAAAVAAAPAAPVAAAAPSAPTTYRPAAAAAQEVPPPPVLPPPAPPPAIVAPSERPPVAAPAEAPPQILKASQQAEAEPAETPIGDWQSEGNKGSVRIERCGRALCGYAFSPSSSARGEAVLINMKPKSDTQWTGNVYSVASGDTYYGTMTVTGPNALRVEACAMGRFYCTGNVWTRIGGRNERLITSRQVGPEPRS